MKTSGFGTIALFVLLLVEGGCACHRVQSNKEGKSDSVRVEYRERVLHVSDTLFVAIPAQTSERTTLDSTSHLENEYALSEAHINTDGTLFHTLATKPQRKAIPTEKEIVYRDSVVYRNRDIVQTKTEVIKEKPHWGLKAIFWGSVGLNVLILIVYIIRRISTHIRENLTNLL